MLAGAKSVEVTIEVQAKSKEILDYMVDEAGDLGLLDATEACQKTGHGPCVHEARTLHRVARRSLFLYHGRNM